MIAQIAARFDATQVAGPASDQQGWGEHILSLREGELWVAKDLTPLAHPLIEWITPDVMGQSGRWGPGPGPARPMLARDSMTVDPSGRIRWYRRLDHGWYAWLFRAARAAQARVTPEAWAVIKARANSLWAVARLWWPPATVASLQWDPLDSRYLPPGHREASA